MHSGRRGRWCGAYVGTSDGNFPRNKGRERNFYFTSSSDRIMQQYEQFPLGGRAESCCHLDFCCHFVSPSPSSLLPVSQEREGCPIEKIYYMQILLRPVRSLSSGYMKQYVQSQASPGKLCATVSRTLNLV
jgi:hypothetical protein